MTWEVPLKMRNFAEFLNCLASVLHNLMLSCRKLTENTFVHLSKVQDIYIYIEKFIILPAGINVSVTFRGNFKHKKSPT